MGVLLVLRVKVIQRVGLRVHPRVLARASQGIQEPALCARNVLSASTSGFSGAQCVRIADSDRKLFIPER